MNTPTLNGGEGEGCGFFCSLKSSYNNFVANCRKSVPFPWRKMSLQKKVTDIKIMTDIFPGPKILCSRNGGIPWIEVPKRRDSTVIFYIILFKFRSSLRKKKLLLWRHLVIQVWYTATVYFTAEWTASIPKNTIIWLVHVGNFLLLSWLLQTKLELCYLTYLITCSN